MYSYKAPFQENHLDTIVMKTHIANNESLIDFSKIGSIDLQTAIALEHTRSKLFNEAEIPEQISRVETATSNNEKNKSKKSNADICVTNILDRKRQPAQHWKY